MKKITYKFPDSDPHFPGITAKGGEFRVLFGILAVRFSTKTSSGAKICTKVKGRPELEALHKSYLRVKAEKKEIARQERRIAHEMRAICLKFEAISRRLCSDINKSVIAELKAAQENSKP